MIKEDKQLLLVDLCDRLPYGVKAQYYGSEEEMLTVDTIEAIYTQPSVEIIIGQYGLEIEDIKPYLRPLSSMTEEEEREYNKALTLLGVFMFEQEELFKPIQLYKNIPFELYEFFNSHHFDYRGLIPKGLAISTDEFNPYE